MQWKRGSPYKPEAQRQWHAEHEGVRYWVQSYHSKRLNKLRAWLQIQDNAKGVKTEHWYTKTSTAKKTAERYSRLR